MKVFGLAAVALFVILVVGVVVVGNPFATTMSERVSEALGAETQCRKFGFTDVVGERETLYRCIYDGRDGQGKLAELGMRQVVVCLAFVEEQFYDIELGC